VLLCVYQNPQIRLREVAERVGITPRMVQNIINDLDHEGFISIEKQGRCNVYSLHPTRHMRHKLVRHRTIEALLHLIEDEEAK
jgi:Mn-dependent DtxR family transcriptional regulator